MRESSNDFAVRKWEDQFRAGDSRRVLSWSKRKEDVIPTGSPGLNAALGIGGYPRGRIIEIYGKYSSGKTSLALAAISASQAQGGLTAYLDLEYKLSRTWMEISKVDPGSAVLLRFSNALETLRALLQLARSGEFAIIVVDSLAALLPGSEIEENSGAYSGELEAVLERALPRIAAAAANTHTCILLLNQVRHNHDPFGSIFTAVGGDVLRHTCSMQIELSKYLKIKHEDQVLGQMSKAVVMKNSVAAPFGLALLPFTHSRGLDECWEAILLAKELNLFTTGRVFLEYQDCRLGESDYEAYEYLLQNSALKSNLIANIALALTTRE